MYINAVAGSVAFSYTYDMIFITYLRLTYLVISYLFTYLHTYSLTHTLTQWNVVLLEKLTGFQLVKEYPPFYRNQKFITTFTMPATCPYTDPAQFSPCSPNHYLTIQLYIILLSKPGPSK
jgi:hypothetical protein